VHRLLQAALDAEGAEGATGGPAAGALSPADALARRVARQARHGLPGLDAMAAAAAACNTARLGARNAQDASGRLFMGLLLAERPVVGSAIVTALGGDRYMDVHVVELCTDKRRARLPAARRDFLGFLFGFHHAHLSGAALRPLALLPPAPNAPQPQIFNSLILRLLPQTPL
jgi:hypothetical protein